MGISKTKITIIISITLIILMLNVIIKNIFNEITLSVFLGIVLSLIIYNVGYEKNKEINQKQVSKTMLFYALVFLILIYGLGLKTGYLKTSYSLDPISIIKNVFPVIIVYVITEILRYTVIKKSLNNKVENILMIILTTIIDVILVINLYEKSSIEDMMKLTTVVIIPSISKNYILNKISNNYGYYPCIGYQLVMNLYVYYLPIIPNLGYYLESVIMFLLPIVIKSILNKIYIVEEEGIVVKKEKKEKAERIIMGISVLVLVIVIGLCSNLMPYSIAAVGSGSMEPTINIGDAIIINKRIVKNLDKIKKGDILVFRKDNTTYTHRIVEIKEENEQYKIKTKGDRKEQEVDKWVVNNKDIVGVVEKRIPYIGYPTIMLNRIIEENKK